MTDTEWLTERGYQEVVPGREWNSPEARIRACQNNHPLLPWSARALDETIAPHVGVGRGATPALALFHLMEHVQEYEVRCLQEATQKLQATSRLRAALDPQGSP